MAKKFQIETTAPFHMGGRWVWKTWRHGKGNTHKAILDKAAELNADAWDFGQATHTRLY